MSYVALHTLQQQAYAQTPSIWFPEYREDYIRSIEGVKGFLFRGYARTYSLVQVIGSGAAYLAYIPVRMANAVAKISFFIINFFTFHKFNSVCEIGTNFFFPKNLINGRRQFVPIPRYLEKLVGDWLLYPLCWLRMQKRSYGPIYNKTTKVCQEILERNKDLLNPENTTPFNYRVTPVLSRDRNAFAVLGGGMVIMSGIFREIKERIAVMTEIKNIKSLNERQQRADYEILFVKVERADGSIVAVDVSDVTIEDVLAALIGHEMVHIAARHSMFTFIRYIALRIIFGTFNLLVPSGDQGSTFAFIHECLLETREIIEYLLGLDFSRRDEYEADITGIYLAQKAGYNPLGALVLQDILATENWLERFLLEERLELLARHPCSKKRKAVSLEAIRRIDSNCLLGKVEEKQKAYLVG